MKRLAALLALLLLAGCITPNSRVHFRCELGEEQDHESDRDRGHEHYNDDKCPNPQGN